MKEHQGIGDLSCQGPGEPAWCWGDPWCSLFAVELACVYGSHLAEKEVGLMFSHVILYFFSIAFDECQVRGLAHEQWYPLGWWCGFFQDALKIPSDTRTSGLRRVRWAPLNCSITRGLRVKVREWKESTLLGFEVAFQNRIWCVVRAVGTSVCGVGLCFHRRWTS